MLPDFSRFLLPSLFSDIQQAAEDGPVIIVNASQYSCDAMIILSAQDPIHIPLDITRAEVSELSTQFQTLIDDAGFFDNHLYEIQLVTVLRTLWKRVVGPTVEALQELLIRPGSRIWWCPTAEFTLLPLHAAGLYEKKSYNLSRYYISSYTPTLAALIRARQQVAQPASTPHFVAIGQRYPYKGEELPHVTDELGDIAKRVTPILPFTSLKDGDATVERALDALRQHHWVHLACHGMPNREKPFDSSFAMRNGPLTITNIIRPRLQNQEFAFLSACHTTVGHASSPDESIHLAAAMQFSGFCSVIGSMWFVDDKVVGRLASTFYDNMVDRSGKLDCRYAAVALHKAVKKLRSIPLEQQLVLIHIGV
jgi:CHAT domain-containing protein